MSSQLASHVICHSSCSWIDVFHLGILFAGIATSLKILFSQEDCHDQMDAMPHLHLERNEVIALVNLLERLSKSIEVVRTMSLEIAGKQHHPQGLGAIQDVVQQNLQDVL